MKIIRLIKKNSALIAFLVAFAYFMYLLVTEGSLHKLIGAATLSILLNSDLNQKENEK